MKSTQSGTAFKGDQMSLPFEATPSIQQQFRPIHYLGSKLRILDVIQSTIDEIDPTGGGVCDLFAGSGTVSKHLSKTRPVTSVDIQEYSRVICSALLKPFAEVYEINSFTDSCKNSEHYRKLLWAIEPMIKHEAFCNSSAISGEPMLLCELIESGSIISFEQGTTLNCSSELIDAMKNTSSRISKSNFVIGPEALAVRYFGGLYFSYLQAVQLDALLEGISFLKKESKDTFLAAALSTASDIVNTVGKQFAQPIKPRESNGTPKKNIVFRIQKDRSDDVFLVFEKWLERYLTQEKSNFNHSIYKMDYSDALDVIKSDIKVIYADPPYTRYHYSRYYHVLETLCLRDNPKVSKMVRNGEVNISRGIYREDRHQSPFGLKGQSTDSFNNLFRKARNMDAALVLSYSPFDKTKKVTPRLQTIQQLENIAKKYYTNVSHISAGDFSHSKLNQSDNNFEVPYDPAELLIICNIS